VATHAGTVAPGYAELEAGFERDRESDGTRGVLLPTVLKIGLAPRAQLSLFLDAEGGTGTPFGAGDVGAGVKWRVLDGHPVLGDVALLPQVTLPTGGPRGTGTAAARLLVINSRSVGPVALDLNVGATWRGRRRHARTAYRDAVDRRGRAAGAPPARLGARVLRLPRDRGPCRERSRDRAADWADARRPAHAHAGRGRHRALRGPRARAVYVGLVTSAGRLR
jgi:hypothetical protein